MGTIRLDDLFNRVSLIRSDVLSEKVQWAVSDGVRRVAMDTDILRDYYLWTTTEGDIGASVSLPAGRELNSILKVEYYDQDLEEWVKLVGPLVIRYDRDDITGTTSCRPYRWGALNGEISFSAPADGTYPMRASVSWAPARDYIRGDIDMPLVAEDAIVAWAKHLVYEISGQGQSIKASQAFKDEYNTQAAGLRSMSLDGEGVTRSVNDWLPMEE